MIVENLAYTQSMLSAELEKKRFYKDALCAVTRGKLSLCERAELESAWGLAGDDKGMVEIRGRTESENREVPIAEAVSHLAERIAADKAFD